MGWYKLALMMIGIGTSILANADALEFVAVGDAPYSEIQRERINQDLAPQTKKFPFLIHLGDFKNGRESCSETLFKQRRDDIFALNAHVFYTPGDNDWTDCDRRGFRQRMPELTSLALLRKLFFAEPLSLPETWRYAYQEDYPENARWMVDDVYFATLHIVATNNGRHEIEMDDPELALSLVDARDEANLMWLKAAFAEAIRFDAKAIVIAAQADMTNASGFPCSKKHRTHCDPYKAFRDQLKESAQGFGKPVLLLHGDTPQYCFDPHFGGTQAPNLWRLNAWGDYREPADATVIRVAPLDSERPFSAHTLLTNHAPNVDCKVASPSLFDALLGR